MRRSLLGLLALFALASPVWVQTAPRATAACAPPAISVTPSTGPKGSGFRVAGSGFFENCPEDGSTTGRTPQERVPLKFEQAGKVWDIGTAFANADGGILADVYVPDGDGVAESPKASAVEGSATVRAVGTAGDPTAPFRVEAGQSDADNTAAGVPPSGSTTSTTAGATTTTAAGGARTTTTARRSTTTVKDIETTTTTEASAATTTTLLQARPTTSTTTEVLAVRPTDDTTDDTARIIAMVGAAILLAGVVGYLLYRSRTTV
jgi:hypothetical protein